MTDFHYIVIAGAAIVAVLVVVVTVAVVGCVVAGSRNPY